MNISVVIPCFNGEGFLKEAIASINAQTYLPLEIVVVDDGSTDLTANILNDLSKDSLVPIIALYQENHGVSAARNVGMSIAKGDWIALLDVDDIWFPSMLEAKVNFAEKMGMKSGLICANYYEDETIDTASKHHDSTVAALAHDKVLAGIDFQALLIKENFIGTASVMMFSRIDAIRIGGFDYCLKHSEDFDFLLRFTRDKKVVVLSEPLALKRHHGNNLTDDKELYFYSHGYSCSKNLSYVQLYSRGNYLESIRVLLKSDLDKFLTGYCNEVYERNWKQGLKLYVKSFFNLKSLSGIVYHFVGLLRKLVRTLSFGLIKNN